MIDVVKKVLDGVFIHMQELYQHQPDATLDQANPVSGTKYTILDTTKKVRVFSIVVQCTWTVQPTPLEAYLTIDGTEYPASQTDPVSTQSYYPVYTCLAPNVSSIMIAIGTEAQRYGNLMLDARSIKIEAEITGGTVSNLSGRVKYAKLP